MSRTTQTSRKQSSAPAAATAAVPTKSLLRSPRPSTGESSKSWTFLTNHSHVLIVLSAEPDLVLREVAQRVGITERAVQRIVQDLEEGGFLRREKVGRKNHYQVLTDKNLRHRIESHRTIGDLVGLING